MSLQIRVLFGSQTGTAEDVAERIGRDLERRHIAAQVQSMDHYDRNCMLEDEFVILVCATTGQGEEPDNMKKFWRFLLRKDLPGDLLSHWTFAVFGLGDSSYEKFNYSAKKLHKRLLQLGGTSLLPACGLGDDQHYLGYEGALGPWLDKVMEKAISRFPSKLEPIPQTVLLPPTYKWTQCKSFTSPGATMEASLTGTVVLNKRVTSTDHFQDIRHISMLVQSRSGEPPSYQPGDVLVMRPQNLKERVDELIVLMHWESLADLWFSIQPTREGKQLPSWIPSVLTLRELLTSYVEPFSVPKGRYFFEVLSHFVTFDTHRERLQELASPAGQEELYEYCFRPKRTCFEILHDFQPTRVPLDYLLDLFPLMRPREFSIASCPSTDAGRVEITVGVVRFKTKMQAPRTGVCTSWLASLDVSQRPEIPISLKAGTMRLPTGAASARPLIMIGPGLGMVPFRSFLRHRIHVQQQYNNYLFYGCRFANKDFLYRDELEQWSGAGQLQLFTVFSRDDPEATEKYVQHALYRERKHVWKLIDQDGAYVYLCGNAKQMPDDVVATFKQIFQEQGGMDASTANTYFLGLQRNKRFQQETWS